MYNKGNEKIEIDQNWLYRSFAVMENRQMNELNLITELVA